MNVLFQSTPPVKAATRKSYVREMPAYISIHAAREGGDDVQNQFNFAALISIHAAREGGDQCIHSTPHRQQYFNPRRP